MSVKQKFIDLVLRGKDLFSKDASKASESLKALQAESKKAADEFKALERSQSAISKAQGLALYAEEAEKALSAATAEVKRLAREIDATEKPTKEQAEALRLASRSANQLQTEYNKLAGQLNRSKAELRDAGINTDKLADEQNRLQAEIKQSATGLSEKRAKLRELSSELKGAETRTNAFSGKLSGVTSRLVAFGAAYVGLNQLRSALSSIFAAGDKFEKLDIQLASVMGSIQAGEQASAWIKDFAKNTPLQLDQVTDTFVRLKNFGLDPMDGVMQAIIDQSEKLGGGYERVQGISLALGQAWAKQKLQGEEILQLIERGVPVWELLENVTGKNTAELQKLSSAGLLGRDVMKQLIDEIGRSAEGQAQKGMSTLTGLISNARDNLDQFYNLIANSGALDFLKGQLQTINNTFAEMAKNGELQKLAKSISDSIVSAAQAVKSFVVTLYEWRTAIGVVAAAWAALKVGSFFKDLAVGSAQAMASLLQLITTKKAAAAANVTYSKSFAPLLAAMAKARAATTAWMAGLTGLGAMLARTGVFAGIAYGVIQIGSLVKAIWDYKGAVDELKTSQDGLSEQEARWKAEIERINIALGTNYETRQQVIKAVEDGILAYNAETESYERASAAINEKTQALIGHGYQLEDTAEKISALEEAYNTLGISSTKNLQQSAEQARLAYETIAAGNEPIEQQRAAFLKYAEAVAKASAASGESVPKYVAEQAAALGLSEELDKLSGQRTKAAEVTKLQADAYTNMNGDLADTEKAINQYRETLDSATATSEEKAKAAEALAAAEEKLSQQTSALNEVRKLELATFAQLQQKYDEYTRQMEQLDELYRNNGISAAEYLRQKDRYVQVLNIIQPMLAGLKDGEQELEQQTNFSNKSLAEQQRILDELAGSTGRAVQYISLLAQAQQALTKEFNLTDKSTSDLSARVKELNSFIAQNNRVTNIWWTDLARASNAAFAREKQIINETLLIRQYTEELKSSSVSLRDVERISRAMKLQFRELGDSELAPLRNAITDAERRIAALRDGLEGTFNSLQDELDRLNDNEAAINERKYRQQIEELNAKLKAATEAGDQAAITTAKKSLALAEQIYRVKTQQLAAESQANSADKSEAQKPKPKPATEVAPLPRNNIVVNSQSSPVTTVRVELALPSGRVYATQASESDAAALMAELQRIRSTSI